MASPLPVSNQRRQYLPSAQMVPHGGSIGGVPSYNAGLNAIGGTPSYSGGFQGGTYPVSTQQVPYRSRQSYAQPSYNTTTTQTSTPAPSYNTVDTAQLSTTAYSKPPDVPGAEWVFDGRTWVLKRKAPASYNQSTNGYQAAPSYGPSIEAGVY